MQGQLGFFDVDDRLARLSDLGDQLEAFRAAVDFELFRPELNATLAYSDGSEGGRPPFDPVMMFKIIVIQATNNLSDERAEFLLKPPDRGRIGAGAARMAAGYFRTAIEQGTCPKTNGTRRGDGTYFFPMVPPAVSRKNSFARERRFEMGLAG